MKFAWLAKGEGFPPLPNKWVKDDNLDYALGLMIASASEIEEGRLAINVPITGELCVLYPPGGSKLDPTKVKGLQLATA